MGTMPEVTRGGGGGGLLKKNKYIRIGFLCVPVPFVRVLSCVVLRGGL